MLAPSCIYVNVWKSRGWQVFISPCFVLWDFYNLTKVKSGTLDSERELNFMWYINWVTFKRLIKSKNYKFYLIVQTRELCFTFSRSLKYYMLHIDCFCPVYIVCRESMDIYSPYMRKHYPFDVASLGWLHIGQRGHIVWENYKKICNNIIHFVKM